MRKLIFSLAITFTAISWVALVPIWHTPDEQSHFGQIAFIVEKGRSPDGGDINDLTEEIYLAEQYLGTARDNLGNNKYTFHPEYRLEYTESLTGKYEDNIRALSKTDAKNKFVYSESTRYPILYYLPASWLYKMFYNSDLFSRVFVTRLWSLLIFLGNIYMVYKLGKLLFPDDEVSALILPILVGFQPMMIFANIGVTSDALGNFLFTAFLFFCAKFIVTKIKIMDILLLLTVTVVAIYSKPQFIITLPLLIILLIFYISKLKVYKKGIIIICSTVLSIGLLVIILNFLRWPLIILEKFMSNMNISSLLRYSWEYTIPHTWKEVLPWYWGIYDWLGVTYPRIVHKIINRIVIIAGIGLLIFIYQIFKKGIFQTKRIQALFFLIIANLIYFIALSFFDWSSWYKTTYQLGIQGRYFFPLISVHMLILLIGWRAVLPKIRDIKSWGTRLLGILMIVLNFYAFSLVASTYYDTSNLSKFILQASQYKPWFFKDGFLILYFLSYLIVLIIGIIYLLFMFKSETRKRQLEIL